MKQSLKTVSEQGWIFCRKKMIQQKYNASSRYLLT